MISANRSEFVKGEVIVRLNPGVAGMHSQQNFAERYGATVEDTFEFPSTSLAPEGEFMQLKLPAGVTTEQALAKMAHDPQVQFAEPNYVFHLEDEQSSASQPSSGASANKTSSPNDLVPQLWGLNNTGQNGGKVDADIDAPEAWNIHTGRNDGPIIAVIDTGVDYNHPDLKANMWVNTKEIPGNGIDDDGNGVIDDVHGFNAFANTGDPMDGHSHGTHCAGTIAAVGNNGVGVVGVNQNARVMGIKIFSDSGSTNSAAILRGIEYATKNGARITSNSWGGGQASEAIKTAFSSSPALHIMAAGNSSGNNDVKPHYPSSYEIPNNIAVAASDRNDAKASFSCYGATSVDIAAPGKDIYSTVPGGGYASKSGTSMATPHVSGVAGLLASAYPEASNEELIARIYQGADKLDNWTGVVATGARLNAHGALTVEPKI